MKILIGSNLHKCFHEAGHIETAYLCGATVAGAQIDAAGNGRTSVLHKQDLSIKTPVACGGFAVEQLLFDSARLVDRQGNPLSTDGFQKQAMENARVDKFPFYVKQQADASGFYPGSPFQPSRDGTWPPESDVPLITYAVQQIIPKLRSRMLIIEALAHELCSYGPLTQTEIEAIRFDMSV
jgi:hypothetical protein